ncbi:MAG TPA: hypothetical protein VG960_07970 [Caulobacteraceae bacterium]|nr:hypothetical protein [Caulobacteraceae bacterium]
MSQRGATKEWLSVSELAALKLPGLPTSLAGMQKLITREGWALAAGPGGSPLVRRRKGRGGGLEYHRSLAVRAPEMRVEDNLRALLEQAAVLRDLLAQAEVAARKLIDELSLAEKRSTGAAE